MFNSGNQKRLLEENRVLGFFSFNSYMKALCCFAVSVCLLRQLQLLSSGLFHQCNAALLLAIIFFQDLPIKLVLVKMHLICQEMAG